MYWEPILRHVEVSVNFLVVGLRVQKVMRMFHGWTLFHGGRGAEDDFGSRFGEVRWTVKVLEESVGRSNRASALTT